MDKTPTNPFVLEQPGEATVLERRRDAAQATLERFRDIPFKPGTVDCVKVSLFVLRQLGVAPKFGRPLNYKTLGQGRALLKSLGFADLPAVLDAHFPDIPPAAAIVGDIIEMEALEEGGSKGLGALVVYMGNGAVFGFHEATVGATVMRIGEAPLRAWRVI